MKLFLKLVCLTAVAIIGPMSNTGRAGDRPTEEVAFYYNKIAFQYATQAVPSGVTFGDSGYEALPVDFFGPGSLPFEGSIPLQRAPELTAMVIERNAKSPPPPPPPPPPSGEKGGTEDINIGVGELQECSAIDPIVVNFINGSTELWDVTVNINSHGPSGGWLRVTHNDPGDGGTIVPVDSFFDVFLDITFSNTPAGGATRHRFFAVIDRTQLNPNVHHPDFLWRRGTTRSVAARIARSFLARTLKIHRRRCRCWCSRAAVSNCRSWWSTWCPSRRRSSSLPRLWDG